MDEGIVITNQGDGYRSRLQGRTPISKGQARLSQALGLCLILVGVWVAIGSSKPSPAVWADGPPTTLRKIAGYLVSSHSSVQPRAKEATGPAVTSSNYDVWILDEVHVEMYEYPAWVQNEPDAIGVKSIRAKRKDTRSFGMGGAQ